MHYALLIVLGFPLYPYRRKILRLCQKDAVLIPNADSLRKKTPKTNQNCPLLKYNNFIS